MRIAHITDCYLPAVGGIEHHVHDLAQQQRLAGHEVHIVTRTAAGQAAAQFPDDPHVHRIGDRGKARRALHRTGHTELRELLQPGRFDAVHVHLSVISPLAFSALRAATYSRLPTVVTVHSLWTSMRRGLRVLDATVGWSDLPVVWSAVGQAAADAVRATALSPLQVRVLPNGVNTGWWRVPTKPQHAQDVVLVSVMRLTGRKEPLPLLAALREVMRQIPRGIRMRATIIGAGHSQPRMHRYLRRHGMADWVCMPGQLDRTQVRAQFAAADLYVAPSRLESFGLAALEARCAGLPVVGRSGSGVAEFIRDGREGLLVDSGADLVSALRRLVCSPDERGRIAEHNRRVRAPFDWYEVLPETERLYADAADLVPVSGVHRKSRVLATASPTDG